LLLDTVPGVRRLPLPSDLGDDAIVLRPFVENDATVAFEACQDPLIAHYTTFPTPLSPEHLRVWIASQPAQRERGEALDLAIIDRGADLLLGAIGIGDWRPEHRRAAAGYWLAPWARGRGVASRALGLLSAWALAPPLELVRLELHVDAGNTPSQRTAKRAGFVREGVLHSHIEAKGRRWDVAVYARLAELASPQADDARPDAADPLS
jgi:RimJ/RimL family protein N-acetyltransferase